MFDILQMVFWGITYILIIITGIRNLDKQVYMISIPYVASILNISWEICALIDSNGYWGHVLWFGLDVMIYFINYSFIKDAKFKKAYLLLTTIAIGVFVLLFKAIQGMLLSSFVIDFAMSIAFLVSFDKISSYKKITIAIAKLLGDCFAGIYYFNSSVLVAITAVAVFCCNSIYLYWCINEYYSYKK